MNPKIEKVDKDIARSREVISQAQARLRELEAKKTELENTDIVAAFRASDIPLAELAAYIRQFRDTPVPTPLVTPEAPTGSAYTTTKEEPEIEE